MRTRGQILIAMRHSPESRHSHILPSSTSSIPPNEGPTRGRGSTSATRSFDRNCRSSSCSTSTILFFRRIKRLEAGPKDDKDAPDIFENPKSKAEKFEEDRVADDSGEVEQADASEGVVAAFDEIENAVLSLRNDVRGYSVLSREVVIVLSAWPS